MVDITSSTAITDLMDLFKQKCIDGASFIQPEAIHLLLILATIDLALHLIFMFMGEGEDPLMLITKKMLTYGFYGFLIQNWVTGISLTRQVFDSFQKLGVVAAGATTSINDPAAIASTGVTLAISLITSTFSLSLSNIGLIIVKFLCAALLFFCFVRISFSVFITVIQFYILSCLTTILLPFSVTKHTAFIAEKAIGSVVTISIKMMVMMFVLCVITPFMAEVQKFNPDSAELSKVFATMIGSAGMAYLMVKLPELAEGLMSGSPSLFAGNPLSAARSVAGTATSIVSTPAGKAMRIAGFAKSAMNAPGGRGANGRVSLSGTARNMGTMIRQSLPDRQAQHQARSLYAQTARQKMDDKK